MENTATELSPNYTSQFLLSEIMNYLYECSRDFAVCIYTFWNNPRYPRNTNTTGI
jgi:hypothetical protein